TGKASPQQHSTSSQGTDQRRDLQQLVTGKGAGTTAAPEEASPTSTPAQGQTTTTEESVAPPERSERSESKSDASSRVSGVLSREVTNPGCFQLRTRAGDVY